MGLFSFIKDAGEKIFGSKEKEEAKAKLEAEAKEANENAVKAQVAANYVRKFGLEVNGLAITVDGEKATVKGEAKDQATKERVVLAVGNLDGIAQVDDQMTVATPPEPEAQFYTVEKGDTLSKIAKQYYGNANAYMKIFDANKPMLKDPDKIYPGQKLRIPAAQ
ncbi:BON domain-containing protein [Catalinimonas alkaloidigena]|uniref:Potassium binding protein Kbp n=1 Tax=Catalinimonas alkaloidigena TaxID=1075417 RepID=A0A1G9SBE4_9BACT|nr:peptidoglycan-binding protein LysM [Catalinimonas alkaloidigena]SDM32798.1 BON domain-containing protein [Catalinimonas alkaloidigena]